MKGWTPRPEKWALQNRFRRRRQCDAQACGRGEITL
jgi:hypothetical protein